VPTKKKHAGAQFLKRSRRVLSFRRDGGNSLVHRPLVRRPVIAPLAASVLELKRHLPERGSWGGRGGVSALGGNDIRDDTTLVEKKRTGRGLGGVFWRHLRGVRPRVVATARAAGVCPPPHIHLPKPALT
jgi:hypothetical protein